jgi:hypothetical protein
MHGTDGNSLFDTQYAISLNVLEQVQVLSNSNEWSSGGIVERAIHTAWVKAIDCSQHLVYIENEVGCV